MVPMLGNADAARAAVAACRYPPAGSRGYAAASQRCTRWGKDAAYAESWQDELLIMGQFESAPAAANAAAIAGVDMPFIGINALAGTIGFLGQTGHPDVRSLIERCEAGLASSGKPIGTVPSQMRRTPELFAAGYTVFAGAVDSMLLRQVALADVAADRPTP